MILGVSPVSHQSGNAADIRAKTLADRAVLQTSLRHVSERGDETGPVGSPQHEPSEGRTIGWLTSSPGNKYLSWDNNPVTLHDSMAITGATTRHCSASTATRSR